MAHTRADWSRHYDDGRGFRPLGARERAVLAEHTPARADGRALNVGCGTGELAAFLSGLGYAVDAVDFAEGALTRARRERARVERVRWLCVDIEHDDPVGLNGQGYDLITLRLVYAFLRDRARMVRDFAARLRPGGALVVITPPARSTPAERRHIALDEDEIGLLTEGWNRAGRFDADGLVMLVLRDPDGTFAPVERDRPQR